MEGGGSKSAVIQTTPMLSQYRRLKQEHRDEVLFFRLGDFYEMFGDDAIEVSGLLNLTLTSRNGLPMCGIPYHATRNYIARLLRHGKKIAICEQVGESASNKNLLEREVVEIITPGTVIDDYYLETGASNYLAALFTAGKSLSFAYIDLSTGEFSATSFERESEERLRQELERLEIREILVQESLVKENHGIARALEERAGLLVNRWADWLFDVDKSTARLCRQFRVQNLKGFDIEPGAPEIAAAGALLDYLDQTAKNLIPHVRGLRRYTESEFACIDESSIRNMELFRNQHDGAARFSLFEVIDQTRTPMGRRLLKRRLSHPLLDIERIERRLNFVDFFYKEQGTLAKIREILSKTGDLERLVSRVAMEKAHGKDMLALKNLLCRLGDVISIVPQNMDDYFETPPLPFSKGREIEEERTRKLMALRDLLSSALVDDPSILLTEGKLIRRGYNAELDHLHELHENGRGLLADYLEEEKEATGINALKIRFNRLIGYYFEVSRANLAKVPRRFIRRQGIAGGERYTTDKLAALESEINGARDKIINLERELFLSLRGEAKKLLVELSAAAARLAEMDVALSTASAATERLWTRPVLNTSLRLDIRESRHPVVEANLPGGEFIPNDIVLDAGVVGSEQWVVDSTRSERKQSTTADSRVYSDIPDKNLSTAKNLSTIPAFSLITGPNMAGKSTYLRQAAIITIMAQTGLYVPASGAEIGIVDRVYCRVGAYDNIARGESTFLVEMNETACILNTATERSLVIMDEVGRGTGTRDGLAIAQAVCEDLLNRVKCRTLFATHYHELSALEHPRLANRSLEVDELDGRIVFRRRLVERPAAESYGLHVARLAGLSEHLLKRAAALMRRWAGSGIQITDEKHKPEAQKQNQETQLSLF
ncbi:MAG: DNA mismatch repair protein MutS [Spirochaetaceae bacterium]|jgi:DNA mismatch repair protein MutS|nr:DNA mismatch repair protein MutS [Spirochaetaceae bacterium]